MSEEIIIDDVNVAECEFLRHCVIPDNEGCKIDDSLCCDVGNCYYKQLKRLQAENKRQKTFINKLLRDISHLDVENRLLKKENQNFKFLKIEMPYDIEIQHYKQALEEIRKMAKIAFIVCNDECGNANKFAEIQDKINEVLK